jgi:hypothetical protein
MFPPIYDALLEIRAALINEVAPQLRAVTVDVDQKSKKLILYFFYDGEISDELFELANLAGTETNYADYLNSEHIIQLDYPKEIPVRGRLAFLRKEPHLPNFKKESRAYLLKMTSVQVVFLLDFQEALLGKVTPALRIAAGEVNTEQNRLIFYFIYDGPISEEENNLAMAAMQEVSVSFSGYQVESHIERIDFPNVRFLPVSKTAYARYEPYI